MFQVEVIQDGEKWYDMCTTYLGALRALYRWERGVGIQFARITDLDTGNVVLIRAKV